MKPGPLSMKWEYFFDHRDYAIAAGAWYLKLLPPDDATWVAATALQRGDDGQYIREVAGLFDVTRREHSDQINRMFDELGFSVPGPDSAVSWFVPSLLIRIRDGGDAEFDLVMSELWRIRHDIDSDPMSGIGSTWRHLINAMYQWDQINEVHGDYGYARSSAKYERAMATLMAGMRKWASSLLSHTQAVGGRQTWKSRHQM